MKFQLALGDDAPETLRSYIDSVQTRRAFGNEVFFYLRAEEIRELASDHNINLVVSSDTTLKDEQRDSMKNRIRNTARKVFLIAIAANFPMETLFNMLSKGLKDADLNLPLTHGGLDAYRDCFGFGRFQGAQRSIPPVLSESTFLTYSIDQCVPSEREASPIATSSERIIYHTCMDTDYHEISALENHPQKPGLSKELAIVEIRASSTTQQSRARSQIVFAEFIATYASHEHIIRPYGKCALRSEYPGETTHYLIAELPHGYLSSYFETIDPPSADDWIRRQLRGLAAALALTHTSTDGRYGVHHDIRPRMIAVRRANTGDVFKLALSEDSRILPLPDKSDLPGNPPTVSPYHSPESDMGQSLSREHDIVALGCVFLEIMVWYTQGIQAYAAFREAASLETLYLIADQADHDLQHTLTETDPQGYKDFTRESLLAQFFGLAEALERIHTIAVTGKAGYVHDIKSPNEA